MAISEAPLPAEADNAGAEDKPAEANSTDSADAKSKPAAQPVTTRPSLAYILFGVGLLVLGYVGGLLLQRAFHPNLTNLPVLKASVGAFALLYVMAQAIERLLVPVSWFGGGFLGGLGDDAGANAKSLRAKATAVIANSTKTALAQRHRDASLAALDDPHDDDAAQAVAKAKHDVDQYRANLTAITFGLAAFLAMMVSGYVGIFLLRIVGLRTAGWLDLLVTGLAIAGGTKPLHDLISNVSSAKKGAGSAK
jgi:hypothetical protein